MKEFTWSGKLKIILVDDNKREKILKKHPSLDINENNKRYPTNIRVTYNKSQKKFLVTFKIGNEVLEGEFKKFASPWLGPSRLWLDIFLNETKSKTKLCIKGDKGNKLFKFFRYDYKKMIPGVTHSKRRGGSNRSKMSRRRQRSSPRRSKSLPHIDGDIDFDKPLIRDEICHNCTDSAYKSHARRYCKQHDRVYNVKTKKCVKKKT